MTGSSLSLLTNENLPEWDLSDLYSSFEDPKVEKDLERCTQKVANFVSDYQGVFVKPEWETAKLLQAIKDYETIQDFMGRLISFSGLLYYKNVKEPKIQKFHQRIQESMTLWGGKLIFFNLELNQIDENSLQKAFTANQELHRYSPWIQRIRQFRPHQLSDDLEKVFLEKSLTSRCAWNRLYDETLASIKFEWEGQDLSLSQITDLLNHSNPEKRKTAALSLSKELQKNLPLLTLITNTLAKDKAIEDEWRHYPEPTSERHLENQVEPDAIEALVNSVKKHYSRSSHRYYALKAKMLGLEQLEYWDRNAPLPQGGEEQISWLQAREIVLNAYHQFNPVMADIGKKFFDHFWIDAPLKDGKTAGAFSHPTVPSVHPYILVNYQGKTRDVMTLAHELGHGIHQVLAAKQGTLLADTPLTLAETASVFGEMLVFRSLLETTTDPLRRRQLLVGKIDDMINTVVRQIAFYQFEQKVHQHRRQGELSADDLNNFWIQTQKEALGPSVHIDSIAAPYWAYISHFIHSPFYVYAYAFGDCLVNSLYAVYQKQPQGFAEKYQELLSAGGSKGYRELLQPFGLQADHPGFWDQGLEMMIGFIDQLEALVDG